jgi:hypothetical protein
LIIPIDLKPLKATMPTTTPTILDQISAEKTKISDRLACLDIDPAKGGNIAAQIFWLKSRARWRERDGSDHRAADGDAEANSPVVLVLPDNGRDSDLVGIRENNLERKRRR